MSHEEQQNQTTTTTNNYIKKLMSVLKTKLNNKVQIAPDKTENKKTCNSPKKIGDQFIMRPGNN